MTWLPAVVTTTAGTGPAQAKSRAVSLDVSEALAVVALLGLGGARERAPVGLVAYFDINLQMMSPRRLAGAKCSPGCLPNDND